MIGCCCCLSTSVGVCRKTNVIFFAKYFPLVIVNIIQLSFELTILDKSP